MIPYDDDLRAKIERNLAAHERMDVLLLFAKNLLASSRLHRKPNVIEK